MKTNPTQKNIPDGWQETKLSGIGVFFKGSGITKEQLTETGHNAVRYGELYTKHNFHIKKVYSYIPDDVVPFATKIQYGDILFAGSGETNDEIGKSAVYLLKEEGYAGGDTIILRPKNANSLFLSYFLNVGEARKKLREFGQGQSVVHIYKSDIESIKLHLPPLPEQNRIVTVLETLDKAVESLGRVIEIKKRVKKGLMQKLLTGAVRLPGFTETWETVKLETIGNIISGGTPSKQNENFWKGTIPWISSSDLVDDDIKYINVHRYITNEAVKDSATKIVPPKSLVFVSRVGVGKMVVNEIALCTSQDFQSLIIKNDNAHESYFLAYRLIVEMQKFLSNNQGTSIKGFLKKDLENFIITLPKGKKEQTAIANVITTADTEITTLEKKLALLKDQKKYLLNNLITGTIRTPEGMKIST